MASRRFRGGTLRDLAVSVPHLGLRGVLEPQEAGVHARFEVCAMILNPQHQPQHPRQGHRHAPDHLVGLDDGGACLSRLEAGSPDQLAAAAFRT